MGYKPAMGVEKAAAIELRGLPLYSQWLTEKAFRLLSSLYLTTRFGGGIQFSMPPNKIPNSSRLFLTLPTFCEVCR